MSDTETDARDQVRAFDGGQNRGSDVAGSPTSARVEPLPIGACLLCFKRGRWPGFYCCAEHEARAKMPAGLGLFDKPHPNHQMAGKRMGRR